MQICVFKDYFIWSKLYTVDFHSSFFSPASAILMQQLADLAFSVNANANFFCSLPPKHTLNSGRNKHRG